MSNASGYQLVAGSDMSVVADLIERRTGQVMARITIPAGGVVRHIFGSLGAS
jgi:hypothetical protein